MCYTFSIYFLKILLLLLLVCESARADEWIWMNKWQMNLLKSLGSIWCYLAQHLGVFFVLLFFFVNIYSHPLTLSSVSEAMTHLCALNNSSILLHPSLLSLLLAPSPQQHKSFFHTSYKKNNISSTLKFLWLLNSLPFPSRQTAGKHHLKAPFFSFLFSHPLLTPWHSLHWLLPLHQRVINNLCQWFLDRKKTADTLQCTFFSYKSVALEISPIARNFMCKLPRLLLHVTQGAGSA